MNIRHTIRAQHISRWTIVATTRPQSLAEHTFNVVAICRDLCRRIGIPDENLIKAALEHDLDEVFTGDMPTPAKALFRMHGMDPAAVEGPAKNVAKLSDDERTILKCADILESVHFLTNFGAGLRAVSVKKTLIDSFMRKGYELPSAYREPLIDLYNELLEPDDDE